MTGRWKLGRGFSLQKNNPYTCAVPQISPDAVVRLILPESHGGHEDERNYSLEELKELLNKLMLMSGKKDHNSAEVEVFSEVSAPWGGAPWGRGSVGAGLHGWSLSSERDKDSWQSGLRKVRRV